MGGGRTHRNSLPGLCRGLWDQALAGESSPDLLLPPNNPLGSWRAQSVGADGDQCGRGLGVTSGKLREEGHPCNSPWDSLPGTLPKPSIWADPGRIVTQGRPVTIWCQASLRADGYYLYKERVSEPFWETSPDSSNKAGFSFASMSSHTAGRYQCAYHSRNIWSQKSDFLPLVVTGKGRSRPLPEFLLQAEGNGVWPQGDPTLTVHSTWGTWSDGPCNTAPHFSLRNVWRTLPLSQPRPCGGLGRHRVPVL